MRAREFIAEDFGPERRPGVLPVGDYLPHDSEFQDPTGKKDPLELIEQVDELINAGIKPRLRLVKPTQLLATQDWLSNDPGDGPMYPEYAKLPVVYQKGQNMYILDGHHRVTAALKSNRTVECYVFTDIQYNKLKQGVSENFADGKVKGKSRPGRVKRSGASCSGSVTDLRKRAKNSSGEKSKMYHWCANMKSGKK